MLRKKHEYETPNDWKHYQNDSFRIGLQELSNIQDKTTYTPQITENHPGTHYIYQNTTNKISQLKQKKR